MAAEGSRIMSNYVLYAGNTTGNVSKEAKYSIRYGPDGAGQIEITYYIGPYEYVRPSTREHPKLVDIVNEAKNRFGGAFYINEFQHVLVRREDNFVYCVGRYDQLLEFDVSGVVVSAEPPAGIKPGHEWIGPHVGRPYVLTADCRDIYYRIVTGYHRRADHLSQHLGIAAASKLAGRLAQGKSRGGRIYINERKHFFAPVQGDEEFLYLGPLGDDAWFPEPAVD